MSTITADQDITKVAAVLQDLLVSKEKAQAEREALFESKVRLFEKENPLSGSTSDVLHLNVGGMTNICVFRSTLIQFEGSMLAAKFSGRWDDSLEKDKDGNIFIDANPELFLKLLTYLRTRAFQKRDDMDVAPPGDPSFDFCCMLEYYDLLPGIYPQQWTTILGSVVQSSPRYGSTVLESETETRVALVHQFYVCSFNVQVEKGSSAKVGWNKSATSEGWRTYVMADLDKRNIVKSLADEDDQTIVYENVTLSTREKDAVIKLWKKISPSEEAFVEVVGTGDAHSVSLLTRGAKQLFPIIHFKGKVTVTGLRSIY